MKDSFRILIVDDFPMIRTMLKRSLTELGFKHLHEASDGAQAWEMIQNSSASQTPYQLVFMDWNMPLMTGIEVVEKCKAEPDLASIPIIMISAERDRMNVIRAMKAGANDYILKPFSAAMLGEKMVAGAKNVIVAMQHTDKEGNSKLRAKCTLPLTGVRCIKKIVSDYGVIEVTPQGFLLKEYAPDLTAEKVVAATEGRITIAPDCKPMSLA